MFTCPVWHIVKRFKVPPYSFTIARALRTPAQVICARSKENVSVFRYFMTQSTWVQKAKLTVNFLALSSVKFRKIWQTGSKYFTLVEARFSGKSLRPVFFAAVKDINLQKSKKLPAQTVLLSCLRFVSHRMRYAVKILEDFTEGNSRKSQI